MSAPVRINVLLRIAVKCFIPTKDNYRAYTPIPRDTEEWNNMAGFCAFPILLVKHTYLSRAL